MSVDSDDTAGEWTEVELELSEEVVEFLEQDHVDADELVNALIAARRATSGVSDE